MPHSVLLLSLFSYSFFIALLFFQKKRSSKPKQYVEMGTQNKSDVDYDWIPKENLEISKSKDRQVGDNKWK